MNKLLTYWNTWWHEHGTKILGFGGVAIGALEYIDDQTIKAVESVAGPHYGPLLSHGLTAIGGLLVARRGYLNTARKKLEADQAANAPH